MRQVTAWLLLGVVLSTSDASAQIHQYPSEKVDQGAIRLRIVDRYSLPVQGATVMFVHRNFSASSYSTLGQLEEVRAGLRTDTDGRVAVECDETGHAWALVERTGFAPLLAYPLFPGYGYELRLDLGTTIGAWCRSSDALPLQNATIELAWRPCATVPGKDLWPVAGARTFLSTTTGPFGEATLEHLPSGQFEIRAWTSGGSVARSNFQVASAFGNEQAPGSDVYLDLQAFPSYEFEVLGDGAGAPEGARAWVGRATLPILQEVRWERAIDGVVRLANLDLRDVAQLHFGAPGHAVQSLNAKDPLTGRPVDHLPRKVILRPILVRDLEFEWANVVPDSPDILVLSPEVLGTTMPTGEWNVLSASGERCRVVEVPSAIDTFAVVCKDRHINGFLGVAEDGTVRLIHAGTVEIRYRVGDASPVGAYVRAIRLDSGEECRNPIPGIQAHRTELCDPEGTVRFEGLLPGRYRFEPHFHYSVFGDALREVNVVAGANVQLNVAIRQGSMVRVRVREARGDRVPEGVLEIGSSQAQVYRMDSILPLDRSGEATLSGLDPEATYTLRFWPSAASYSSSEEQQVLVLTPPHPPEVDFVLSGREE